LDDSSSGRSWSAGASPPPAEPAPSTFPCPNCRQSLAAGTLLCPRCGELVYRRTLQELANSASALEPIDPARAAMLWQQCLPLLPDNAPQRAAIVQHISALSAGFGGQGSPIGGNGAPTLGYEQRRQPPPRDPWPLALLKTGGSMLLSILVYGQLFHNFHFALGFVLLILIHEMGHVAAMWYYGLSASPPIFIPFVGALINLRQNPPNALVEAVVGIGGPLAGTLGALACYGLFYFVPACHTEIFYALSVMGFFLNLFNLLPMPPLDGGRIMAAVSPWMWIVGVAGLVALIIRDLRHSNYGIIVMLLIFFYGVPRIRQTLLARGRHDAYYQIDRLSAWAIGALYVTLAITLSVLLWQTNGFRMFGF
jgi:Zn-dependent protease